MIENWTKVWSVDEGSVFEAPRIRAGLVSKFVFPFQYIITHEDGTEKRYTADNIFLSLPEAHARKISLTRTRVIGLRTQLQKMEQSLQVML